MRGYDIGLIRLDRKAPLHLPRIDKIGVSLQVGDYLTAAGWGSTDKKRTSNVLRVVDKLIYVGSQQCAPDLFTNLGAHTICAGSFGRDTCRGERVRYCTVSSGLSSISCGVEVTRGVLCCSRTAQKAI